jgi:phage tail-like protein
MLSPHDDAVGPFPAPDPLAHSSRLIANTRGIWAMDKQAGTIHCYQSGSFTKLVSAELAGLRLMDLVYLDCKVLGVLAHGGTGWLLLSVDCEGQFIARTPLGCLHDAIGCTFLRESQQLVVLTGGDHPRLFWYTLDGGPPKQTLAVALRYPCCKCFCIAGSDSIYVAAWSDGQNAVLVLDADGAPADIVPIAPSDAPMTGLAATGDSFYLTGPRGLLRFSLTSQVPAGSGEIACTYLSPMMQSPDAESTTYWLRADCTATLPDGCSLEISAASTSSTEIRDRINAIAGDNRHLPAHRIETILGEAGLWQHTTLFHGESPAAAPDTFSAPLFDMNGRYLWLAITLRASSEARLPSVREFAVFYPGHGLMEYLPALYRFETLGGQRNPIRNDGFARALVGVLEATTQDVDAKIRSMGANIDPATAPEEWLNYVARWLYLPWDDALSLDQKHALVNHAAELTRLRGTRAGLQLLLQCLLPGMPVRFRVTDSTADNGFAMLDCDARLPVMLAGFPRGRAELGPHAMLGRMRLPCSDQPDDPVARWLGKVRVEIAATALEKQAWEPWLKTLLMTYLPATVSLVLSWTTLHSLRSGAPVLDDSLVIEAETLPHLGSDAITGLARLPESETRLAPSGLPMGTRLR